MNDDADGIRPALTPRAREVLDAAAQVATAMGHTYVGTEHLLIALLNDVQGIAGQLLNRADRGQILRSEVDEILHDPLYRQGSTRIYPS